MRAANVKALSDSLVLTCHRDDFQTHLGRLTDIRRLWRFEALRKVMHTLTLMPLGGTCNQTCWLAAACKVLLLLTLTLSTRSRALTLTRHRLLECH